VLRSASQKAFSSSVPIHCAVDREFDRDAHERCSLLEQPCVVQENPGLRQVGHPQEMSGRRVLVVTPRTVFHHF
jgi:hypothetical protein